MSLSALAPAHGAWIFAHAHAHIIIAIFRPPPGGRDDRSNRRHVHEYFQLASSASALITVLVAGVAVQSGSLESGSSIVGHESTLELKPQYFVRNVYQFRYVRKKTGCRALFNLFLGYFQMQRQHQVIWHAHHVVQFMQMRRRP